MIVFPNAKINLGLQVTSKRSDGYHNISSIFVPIDWCDALEIIPSEQFEFTTSGLTIPSDSSSNLCVKAYKLIKSQHNIQPVKIHLHKVIPMGAGMGGGSSDGAFTLKLLNKLLSLDLSNKQLMDYAKRLGADSPFFIENQPKFVTGIGEEMENIEIKLSNLQLVVVYPHIHIDTATAFGGITPKETIKNLRTAVQQPISSWVSVITNDFEKSIFPQYPQIKEIKAQLLTAGAAYASMTGTGAAVYAYFKKKVDVDFPNCTVWSKPKIPLH